MAYDYSPAIKFTKSVTGVCIALLKEAQGRLGYDFDRGKFTDGDVAEFVAFMSDYLDTAFEEGVWSFVDQNLERWMYDTEEQEG